MTRSPEFRKSLGVVIGIDHYGGGVPELRTAVNDARRVGELLAREHGYDVREILDGEATLDRLRALFLQELTEEVGPDDRVFLYFAGHGVARDGDEGPNGYLLPQDARRGEPETWLYMPLLHDALLELPCRHMLVVMDSCFSGAFRWSSMRDLVPLPDVIHRERFDRYLQDAAWQVITSSAHDQTALDELSTGPLGSRGERGGHSPFALSLFEALEGAGDLVPAGGDGVITATELYLFIEERLQTETAAHGLRQTPRLWPLRKHDKGEFIFLVPGRAPDLPPAPPLTFENNPYRGLSAYEPEDAELFFGRGEVTARLAAQVEERPLTVVLGASGTGKSSVVKAGLVPRLADAGWHIVGPLRPGAAPLQALAEAVGADQPATPQGVRSALEGLCEASPAGVLLVVDQLEELVTATAREDARATTLELLAGVLDGGLPGLRVVLTLRSDFEAHFDRTVLEPWWAKARIVIPPPTRDELREIIEQPAAKRVIYFQPAGLVDELIDAVIATPGGLPLLSFTMSEMYVRYVRRQSDDRALTHDDYAALGGVVGALRTRADAEYEALDEAHRGTLRRLMLRMVVPERENLARRRVTRAELDFADPAENERVREVITRFTEARLLVEGTDALGEAYVEPAHDALVRAWGRLLAWIHEEDAHATGLRFQHELARTARAWGEAEGASATGLLWRDPVRSNLLSSVLREAPEGLNRREAAFARRSVRRRRIIRGGLAALVSVVLAAGIVATVLGFLAEDQRQAAMAQRNEALRQTRAAQSSQLNAQAVLALDGSDDARKAALLAAAALRLDSTNTSAEGTLLRALYGGGLFPYRGRLYAQPTYTEIGGGSPSGGEDDPMIGGPESEHFIAAEGILNDHSFEFIGARAVNGRYRGGMELERDAFVIRDRAGEEVAALADSWAFADFTRDGRYLVTGSMEGEVALWEIREDYGTPWVARLATLGGHTDAIYAAYFSDDETRVVTSSRDGTRRDWRLTARPVEVERVAAAEGGGGEPAARALVSADGRYAAHLLGYDTLAVVALATGDTVARRYIEFGSPELVHLSEDGSRVYADLGNSVLVWEWAELVGRDLVAGFQVEQVAVSPEGMVAVHAIDGVTRVWDTEGRQVVAVPMDRSVYLTGVELGDEGRILALRSRDGDTEATYRLPLDPAHLMTTAWGGIEELTPGQRARWELGPAADPSPATASAPESLLQILADRVRARLGGSRPEPVAVDSTRMRAARRAWSAWEQATACTEGYETVRMLLACGERSGALRLLEELAGTPIFLEGPHAPGEMDGWSHEASRYNPAFVAWATRTLVPQPTSPVMRLAGPLYDRWLRDDARAYLYARLALEDRPEFRARLLEEVAEAADPGRHAYHALLPLGDSLQAARGVDATTVAWAGTFWIRRARDGTEAAFASGLDDLLDHLDPGFRETAAQPPPTRAFVAGPGPAFEAVDAEASCDGLDFGVRTRYCAARRSGLVALLARAADMPVFLDGPHPGTDLVLDAPDDFGRYNPDFVAWVRQTLIPGPEQETARALAQPVFDRRLRTLARAYWLALQAVEDRPELVARVAAEYLEHPDPGRYIQDEMSFLVGEIGAVLGDEAAYVGSVAGGFWIRRHMDGSKAEFQAGLRTLLETFDGDWLGEVGAG